MPVPNSYPMTITPLVDVRRRKDAGGRPYLSFRARTQTAERSTEKTVRCFGPNVADFIGQLRKEVPVSGRLSYDSFTGGDGKQSQSLRLISLDA